jgi:hypothetical protein
MRSNSLHPYELVAVASAAPADGGGADLVLRLRRGDKHEELAVKVKHDGGRYGLVSFAPAH